VNLSSVTTTDGNGKLYYAAKDGQIFTTSSGFNGYVTVPDGATVTLDDVQIGAPHDCDHAAIHCLGSANLIVNGVNQVDVGNYSSYPAIYVPHNASGTEYTLTISGTGTLLANAQTSYGAAIGGGLVFDSLTSIPCGNIVLNGATINATSGWGAAGIGGGHSGYCGDITINGAIVQSAIGKDSGAGIGGGYGGICGNILISSGSVGSSAVNSDNATSQYGAGIGCGQAGKCGTITIGSGIDRVNAKKGNYSDYYIGGDSDKCGTVTIDDVVITEYQMKQGVNTNPTFPHLNSYCNNVVWRLYKPTS
jgi:hypothetical protein